jgi:hypothetical protein
MRKRQLGVSLGGLLVASAILIVVALLGLRLAPSYMEYFTIKKVMRDLAGGRAASPAEIRKSFDQRAVVDGLQSIKGADLEVTKEGGELLISASYRKEIPLFGNLGLYIDFAASSKGD